MNVDKFHHNILIKHTICFKVYTSHKICQISANFNPHFKLVLNDASVTFYTSYFLFLNIAMLELNFVK